MTVDVGGIESTDPGRDSNFRNTAPRVSQLPKVTFSFTNPVAGVRPTPGQPQSFTATAELMLHGVTKTVTVMLNSVRTGRGGQVTGSIPITFSDCGGPAPGVGFVTVESAGSIESLLNPTQE